MKYLKLYEDFVSETMQLAVLKHQANLDAKRKEDREKRRKEQESKNLLNPRVTHEEGETEAESDEVETGAQMEPEQFDLDMDTEGSSEEETEGY